MGRSTAVVAWHPEWWVYAVAGASAVVLVVGALASAETGGAATGHHVHTGQHATPLSPDVPSPWASWPGAWLHWTLMVAAMMLPVVAPQVRRVALLSVRSRRQRAAASFLVGYVVVWLLIGAALVTALAVFGSGQDLTPWLVLTLLAAAVWQVSAPRRRMLRRCASLKLGVANGFAADIGLRARRNALGPSLCVHLRPLDGRDGAEPQPAADGRVLAVLLNERARGANPRATGRATARGAGARRVRDGRCCRFSVVVTGSSY